MKLLCLLLFISANYSFGLEAPKVRILILGDSLTEGYGVTEEQAYPNQLKIMLQKKHPTVEVVNAGSSGSTSAGAISRLKWHFRLKPKILVLALGGNDGLRGVKPEATFNNLSKAITYATQQGTKVVLAGMKMPINYGVKYRKEFQQVYKRLVKKHKIISIPFLLKGVAGVKELNLPDGIHPNKEGHKKIAETVYDVIVKEL